MLSVTIGPRGPMGCSTDYQGYKRIGDVLKVHRAGQEPIFSKVFHNWHEMNVEKHRLSRDYPDGRIEVLPVMAEIGGAFDVPQFGNVTAIID